jgi:hypothetical protein
MLTSRRIDRSGLFPRTRPLLDFGKLGHFDFQIRTEASELGHYPEIQLWGVTGLRVDYSVSREPRASVSRAFRTSSRKNRRSSMASFVRKVTIPRDEIMSRALARRDQLPHA